MLPNTARPTVGNATGRRLWDHGELPLAHRALLTPNGSARRTESVQKGPQKEASQCTGQVRQTPRGPNGGVVDRNEQPGGLMGDYELYLNNRARNHNEGTGNER